MKNQKELKGIKTKVKHKFNIKENLFQSLLMTTQNLN